MEIASVEYRAQCMAVSRYPRMSVHATSSSPSSLPISMVRDAKATDPPLGKMVLPGSYHHKWLRPLDLSLLGCKVMGVVDELPRPFQP